MTNRLLVQVVNVPKHTAASSPVKGTWTLPTVYIGRVWVVIPAGALGLTGIQLTWAGVQIVPLGSGWLIGDNEVFWMDLGQDVAANQLGWAAYNTDTKAHSFYLRAVWEYPAAATVGQVSSLLSPLSGGTMSGLPLAGVTQEGPLSAAGAAVLTGPDLGL